MANNEYFTTMATVTINYDARNAFAVSMIETLKKSGAFQFATPATKPKAPAKKKMASIDISLKEIEEGKVHTYNSSKEMFEKLGITL